MRNVVNRVVLALIGLLLVAGGGAALLAAVDPAGRWGVRPPSWLPWRGPDAVPFPRETRAHLEAAGWWWPVIFTALGAGVLLALWWLVAQLKRRRPARISVPGAGPGEDGVQLRGRALAHAVADEAELLPGVWRARAALFGTPARPRVRVLLTLRPEADPVRVLAALADGPLRHARESVGLAELPADVRLRVAEPSSTRVDAG
ncbi:alkaline shock response membrane anchor protein AmaP [Allostreptomyces psammosilenae]|uniref:Alkaline shock response membrane anchor protein AmaP n=1 Tax=Allostreptomyces psammosilenae TaxID=1892865 RepID=A0A852ZLP3_9ACTN|nr:alkaline shock response membrane anchor protein AmaP [Allostreptomyces psammosilenae]NYI03316.1 hypothetical protein [Allostreptomyces psammosilenae]